MEPQYSEHPSMFRNNPLGFILAILLIPVAVGILILLWWYLQCMSTKLEFVGNDLVLEKGLLSKARMELDVRRIRSVNVYQSFFNRIFGVGKISIYTAGDNPEIEVAGLPNPHELRTLIKAQQQA
ncbi:PH domain-containing protein [Marinobacter lacisalsi]|uniref:PH domain-containing protein n=1 Tax=Marinobacter lacisalsi TaxID=475979 RepID=A0ABV8QMM1_9GAMM